MTNRAALTLFLSLLLLSPVVDAAPRVLTGLLVERGGNMESLGNERIHIRYDGAVVYERGRAFQRKDPKYGMVTDGVCDRFTWKLSAEALEALRAVADKADIASLEHDYHRPGVHDGSQAGMLAQFVDLAVVSRFDNELPPAYRTLNEYLTTTLLKDYDKRGKKSRCDVATWMFIRPPNDRP